MEFPTGITKELIVEAGDLVVQAYAQYQLFLQGQSWIITGDYDALVALAAAPSGPMAVKEPFGFIARNKTTGTVFVIFRGTESIEDWLSDFIVTTKVHPWGEVEEGFYRIFAQCAKLVRQVPGLTPAPSRVVFAGHSLGAALATLAAAEIAQMGFPGGVQLVTFAGPRVGDPVFADNFNKNIPCALRIVNTEDVVPTMPLPSTWVSASKKLRISFSAISHLVKSIAEPDLNYMHVGEVACFTRHEGSIPANHAMSLYSAFTSSL
jgi:triacylglycerol lipase